MQRHYDDNGKLDWIAPGAVRYDADDLSFLLPWLAELREGAYPAEPLGGYVEGKRSGIVSRAHYEAACQVAAEIDSRLAMTGTDRFLVEQFYCRPWEDDVSIDDIYRSIAREVNMQPDDVRRRINSAVSYISSGPCPRWLACQDCGRQLKCDKFKRMNEKGQKRITYNYRQWVRSRSHQHQKERSRK